MNIGRNLRNKSSKLLIHLVIWAIIFLLPYIFTGENPKNAEEIAFRNLNTATVFLWMGLFYLNAEFLIPLLFYGKKYFIYTISLVSLFILIMGLHGALFAPLVPGHPFNFLRSSAHNFVPFLFTVTVSATYKIFLDKIKADETASEKQKENLKAELSFLRSQISPHFLFNVLNNIVAMVRMKSEDLEPTVIKLSSLLQYMLYETDEEKVLLKNEAEYLQSYIDLQQMRYSTKLNLQVHLDVKEEWLTIEPMLLIPFVENAFKHGNGLLKDPEIHIYLKVENNRLEFEVKNKYVGTDTAKDKTSGIGLANVKRRLELLYEKKHTLKMIKQQGWFIVSLQLILAT
ncbi:MAG TPA: histidine kinase [Chitinophagaceae bacterium]|nr:histidine kinase [Chitinophagaceae bacterium]